jgi:CspA family cold shock protein
MEHGTVKWYSESRGAGIIVRDNGLKELAVTHSAIVDEGFKILYEGQRVWFEIMETAKGPAASDVTMNEGGQ